MDEIAHLRLINAKGRAGGCCGPWRAGRVPLKLNAAVKVVEQEFGGLGAGRVPGGVLLRCCSTSVDRRTYRRGYLLVLQSSVIVVATAGTNNAGGKLTSWSSNDIFIF